MWSIVGSPLWRGHRFLLVTVLKHTRCKTSSAQRRHTGFRLCNAELPASSGPHYSMSSNNPEASTVQKPSSKPSTKRKKEKISTTSEDDSIPIKHLSDSGGSSPPDDDEVHLTEADVRLAMRTLMEQHLSQKNTLNRIADEKLKRQQRLIKIAHESRLRRIEEKTHNSMKLLGADGAALGDGILPLFSQHRGDSSSLAKASNSASSMTDWRAYNPVSGNTPHEIPISTEADEVRDEWEYKTLQSLCEPNLSVYDSEHDIRIRTGDALREEEEIARSTAAGVVFDGEGAVEDGSTHSLRRKGGTSSNAVLDDKPIRPISTSMLQYEVTAEEDEDFPVHIYEADND
ncbi:unnamed protein product [Phytomonas sp. EM1]|nr:unnamed protein product [Phytomonas sp. EM1]|eukprot:CCW62000.1 unnamed protein product [Phytomonas sp. isolate EM1]